MAGVVVVGSAGVAQEVGLVAKFSGQPATLGSPSRTSFTAPFGDFVTKWAKWLFTVADRQHKEAFLLTLFGVGLRFACLTFE